MVYGINHALIHLTIQKIMTPQHFHTFPSICKSLDTVQIFLAIILESLFVKAEMSVDISQTWSSFAITVRVRTIINDGLVSPKCPEGTDYTIDVAEEFLVGHFEDMDEDSQKFKDLVEYIRKPLERKINDRRLMLPKY